MHQKVSPLFSWTTLAKPRVFSDFADKVLPVSLLLTALFLSSGLYVSLVSSPADYLQGELVRIMYVHVPAAWMALLLYTLLALLSFISLVWRTPLAEIVAQSLAPLGAFLTFLSLLTGALWGKPTWGTFWVWDARLTSVFLLLLTYLLYERIRKHWGSQSASLFALVGLVNIPIIKGSVTWWNTLHQGASLSKFSEPSLPPSMVTPLILMALAYLFYSLSATLLLTKARLNHRKKRTLA